jgi:hypothetical protein
MRRQRRRRVGACPETESDSLQSESRARISPHRGYPTDLLPRPIDIMLGRYASHKHNERIRRRIVADIKEDGSVVGDFGRRAWDHPSVGGDCRVRVVDRFEYADPGEPFACNIRESRRSALSGESGEAGKART